MSDVPVLIVGGGPVGLTLGIDLAHRGVPSLLVEQRTGPTEHPKATLLGARSMELFRRWGLDEAIYDAAIPAQNPYFIVFTTQLAGRELHRVRSPSIAECRAKDPAVIARYAELQWSPYGKTQIGQQALEPVLLEHARGLAPLEMRHGWRFEGFSQDAEGVSARIVEVASGRMQTMRAAYLADCEGGVGPVRRQLGIGRNGRGKMRANVSLFFRSDSFLEAHGKGLANLYFVFTPGCFGVFTAIDGRSLWNFQYYFLDPARQAEPLDSEAILFAAMGKPFDFELLTTMHWHHHQSVARTWRAGRVFLLGDAAHLFAPTGGVGMNTGVGDACDLAWKLAAVHHGWGGPTLLSAYELERKPIAVRNSLVSAMNSDKIDMVMDETPADIGADTAAAAADRAILQRKIRWLSRQFSSAGVHLGYRYVDSDIIAYDGTPEPTDDTARYVPTTWPGARAPHAWLADGRSTLDLLGEGFTLFQFSAELEADAARIADAFTARGAPIAVAPLDDPQVRQLYERALVLVRPDGHVAWRGDRAPPSLPALAAHLMGWGDCADTGGAGR